MSFFKENLRLFSKVFPFVFGLNLISNICNQWLTARLELLLKASGKFEEGVFFYGALSVLSTLVFPVLMTSTTLWGVQQVSLRSTTLGSNLPGPSFVAFLRKYFEQILIETLRAWGKSFQWFLCFIVPGFIVLVFYYLVPFVVVLSENYERGQIDALKTSVKIAKTKWFQLSCALLIFGFAVPVYISTVFDSYYLIWKTPVSTLLVNAFETYWIIFTPHLIFQIIRGNLLNLRSSLEPSLL